MISAKSSSHPPLYQSRHSLRGAMAVQALQQLLRRDSCRLGAQMTLPLDVCKGVIGGPLGEFASCLLSAIRRH